MTELSSRNNGGTAATVQAVTNGPNYTLTVTAPSDFLVAPPEYAAATTFAAEIAIGSDGGQGGGLGTVPLAPGVTQAAVDLTATAGSGIFSTGAYAAEVVVTCE